MHPIWACWRIYWEYWGGCTLDSVAEWQLHYEHQRPGTNHSTKATTCWLRYFLSSHKFEIKRQDLTGILASHKHCSFNITYVCFGNLRLFVHGCYQSGSLFFMVVIRGKTRYQRGYSVQYSGFKLPSEKKINDNTRFSIARFALIVI